MATSPTTGLPRRLKQWVGTIFKRNVGRDIGEGSCFRQLPMELVIEIAMIAASSSQKTYRTFLLVSKEFRALMERECIPLLPIRLETTASIIAFHKMVLARPDLAETVRHLWIRGARSRNKTKNGFSEPTSATWRQFKASAFEQLHIIHSCTNLVSLACSFPVMFISLHTKAIFVKHEQLRELTLFENWDLWPCFRLDPNSCRTHLFLQLTHLLILDCVAPHFSPDLFPALKYFSARADTDSRQATPCALTDGPNARQQVDLPSCLRSFSEDVKIMLHMEKSVELGVTPVAGGRWSTKVGEPQYFRWWCERIAGGQGAWSG